MKEYKFFIAIVLFSVFMRFPLSAGENPRNIMLLFDLKNYDKQISAAIDCFFQNFLSDKDQLIIMTPTKRMLSYSSQTLSESREKIRRETKELIRKHASVSGAGYQDVYNEMLNIVNQIQGDSGFEGVKNLISAYDNYRKELAGTRTVNEELLFDLIDIFQRSKHLTGETKNLVFLFFQREYRPAPNKNTLNALRENQLVAFQAAEVFLEERSRMDFDTKKIGKKLNIADVIFNFIYISHKKQSSTRFQRIDNSGDFYSAMNKIADMTGGMTVTTTKPHIIFENF